MARPSTSAFSPDSWSYYDLSQTVYTDFYHAAVTRAFHEQDGYSRSFPPLWPVLIALVDKAKANGFTGVKFYGTFDPGWLPASIREAHKLGLHVHGHIPAGIRTMEELRRVNRQVVGLSPELSRKNRELKHFLMENLYRHYKVERMRVKAERCLTQLFQTAIYFDWINLQGLSSPVLLPVMERVTAKVLGQKDLWYANVSWTDYQKFRAEHKIKVVRAESPL
jgi:hypothetical protein